MIQGLVGNANVVGDALSVFVVGYIGDAADVEACFVIAEKQFVANGNQWRTLTAFAHVFAAEIVDDGNATCLGKCLSVTDL